MTTDCTPVLFDFQPLGKRAVQAAFDGGAITSDGGGLLLREVERRTGILAQFAQCFTDYRKPELIEHPVARLVAQRVYGLCLGYEDLNDHDLLRRDPLLAVLAGHPDPWGTQRRRQADVGCALAGKSTLNRLERTPATAGPGERYKKVVYDAARMERLLVDVFVQAHEHPPREVVLDLDDTDNPLYGQQEGRFYHGYYDEYCYLPLYIFSGEHLLCAKLREAGIDHAEGALEELQRIAGQLRKAWPGVRLIIRGDSGFCREELVAWCEGQPETYYVLGLARNQRLAAALSAELEQARQEYLATGRAARVFKDFRYQTLESWSVERRVIGKAEHLEKGANPRFVVTNLPPALWAAQALYEELYCARGEMENRIKEQQLYLFSGRTSAETMRANQLRLWFSAVAYLLMHALRRLALQGTELARAHSHTLRTRLLKVGALIRVSVRRIYVSLAGGWPFRALFAHAYWALCAQPSG